MFPVTFPEQNSTFKKADCMDLPALHGYNQKFDADEIVSCWEFTDEEIVQILKAVKEGKRPQIFLSVIGGQPPVSLFMRSNNHARHD